MCNKISALAWKIVNEVSGRNNSNRATLKTNCGKEQIQIWNDHFKKLLSKPLIPTSNDESTFTIQNELDTKKGIFTIDELKIATKSITNGKPGGLDETSSSMETWRMSRNLTKLVQ